MDDRPANREDRDLMIVGGYEGVHLVSRETIRRAEQESEEADRLAHSDDEPLPESDDDVEDVYTHAIARGMVHDVPDDVLDEFGLYHELMFMSEPIAFVTHDQLAAVTAALVERGYRVLDDEQAQ